MSLMETINVDITNVMKAKDKFALSVLRMLKSSIKNEEINKGQELNDEEIIVVIKKQVKVRKDSRCEYEEYNRLDLVESLNVEIDILSKYLPEEMNEDEILSVIDQVIDELKPDGIKGMGLVMRELTTRLATRADMQLVSSLVRSRLV